jgi:hypothetical protein
LNERDAVAHGGAVIYIPADGWRWGWGLLLRVGFRVDTNFPACVVVGMDIEQRIFDSAAGWELSSGKLENADPQLVLALGDRHLLEAGAALTELRKIYPQACVVSASTAGEIFGTEVSEQRIVATAIAFKKTSIKCAASRVTSSGQSYGAGRDLAQKLTAPGLVHVFVLSDGQVVNGTDLARGFNEHLPAGVQLSGGLAGDGTRFERTVVGLNDQPVPGHIVAVGFYGSALTVRFGSAGGWEAFGPERIVTRAEQNTLYELDGQSALQLYKKYLGDRAAQLPGSALRFPLCITPRESDHTIVRTILSIDETAEGMIFAGDIPMGAKVRFMRASYEDLIDGAALAAEQTRADRAAELALCVSCVGRRIVLGQRTEEETESVRAVIGEGAVLAGFYSYGELAPAGSSVACQLHNQTMTITTFRED